MPTGKSVTNDLRVRKSIRDIKAAVLSLIAKEPFSDIRVGEIADEAMVNRKTFYRYYSSKSDVIDDIAEDMLSAKNKDLSELAPDDLRGGSQYFTIC